jgi:hypothetical protein
MTTFFKIKKTNRFIHPYFYFVGHLVAVRVVSRGLREYKRNAGSLIDDVMRDIVINFMLTCHKMSFLIGQFEVEV